MSIANHRPAKLIVLCSLLLMSSTAWTQVVRYKFEALSLPASTVPFFSFYVSNDEKIFVPINGGLYVPRDTSWFAPPASELYFTSFIANLADTSILTVGNTKDSTEIHMVKNRNGRGILRYKVATIPRGMYQLIEQDSRLCIWGHDRNGTGIGIISKEGVRWLLHMKGIIQQVQVDHGGNLLFLIDNTIYNLNEMAIQVQLDVPIFGFDVDSNGNFIVSLENGITMFRGQQVSVVAKGVKGLVECVNDNIYVLPRKGKQMYRIYAEK